MSHPYRDHYFHRAKKERYLARAIYKLEQIQKKHRILKPGQRVLDLGAAPGSWIQFTERVVGPKGVVVGVDLQPIAHPFPSHVITFQRDIFEEDTEAMLRDYAPFDVVLSDMAPKTSGIKVADAARSELLYERALDLACRLLRPGGHFCSKIFQGSDFHALVAETKRRFQRVKVVKPDASRKQSKEIYILAMKYKAM
ncbi:23S rRNA Um-2552 2'-O-methyltransferase [Desulfacinum hydrothermale DSM 13146]|uniref:Ribosomal RNA large subunit methyltransferase E n=1 Tax=Desulfacinum hydrothermale DSM 13146 TaxID=1121390 RepID=A0A1W1WYT3_9BACT|nr:RlmE family RNA methyltransferase [Desulfacinum hydrothermale]SMC16794.1 23S rRNA Um-2552 2'-O-methyltransferase [Desulfacinum hydrothermale DSM 13146]